jgi:hypothetical protein
MCDSGRAGARGGRQVKNPLAQVFVGPVSIRATVLIPARGSS